MSLTDEQLLKLWAPEPSRPVMGRNKILEFARAIESAATAPLLERIAELERANAAFAARQDWWHEKMFRLERELEALRKDAERDTHVKNVESKFAVCKWNDDADEWWPVNKLSIDAAIDAAKDQG